MSMRLAPLPARPSTADRCGAYSHRQSRAAPAFSIAYSSSQCPNPSRAGRQSSATYDAPVAHGYSSWPSEPCPAWPGAPGQCPQPMASGSRARSSGRPWKSTWRPARRQIAWICDGATDGCWLPAERQVQRSSRYGWAEKRQPRRTTPVQPCWQPAGPGRGAPWRQPTLTQPPERAKLHWKSTCCLSNGSDSPKGPIRASPPFGAPR